jgi:hypothetical protein
MGMNRIYQGKVTAVEIPDGKDEQGKPLIFHRDIDRARVLTERIPALRLKVEGEISERAKMSKEQRDQTQESAELKEYHALRAEQGKEWRAALWDHHQLFHDAVNYYAFALAAMAEGMVEIDDFGKAVKDDKGQEKKTAMAQFAEQVFGNQKPKTDTNYIEGRWEDFTHKGTRREGLKHSLSRTLGLDPKTVTREQCIERILGDALKKFSSRKDAEGRDVFHGVISELFPAKSRGTPKKLANEDPGWLCWKDKTGEPPAEKTYRNQQGIYDFMAELFSADAASMKKLAEKSVLETCLSGVTKAKASDEEDVSENEEADNSDADEGGETDEKTEAVKCFTGLAAINQLRKCVRTAKTLLLDSEFKRDFDLLGGGRFNARGELARLLKCVRRLKANATESPESLKFQEWKRNGDGKDNERVELFVLLHFAGKHYPDVIEFAGALLMTRLKRRLLGAFRKNSPKQYLDFVQRFGLAGSEADGKESKKQIEIATRAVDRQARGETKLLPKKTKFIPRIRKAVGYVFPSFTTIRGFIAQADAPAEANGACTHGHLGWPKFDNSAYEEAIKSPHQIREKQKERDKEKGKLETLKELYEGKGREKGKDDDGEDEDHIPGFKGDPRFDAMKRIHAAMAVADGVSEGKLHEYGISQAALRGYEELREDWSKVVGFADEFTDERAKKLKERLVTHQQQHRDDMGDSRFFEQLIKQENWCVWQAASKEVDEERIKNRHSTNIVRDYLRYSDVLDDLEKKKRPIQYTPADASESRRLFDLKAASKGAIKHFGCPDGLSFTTQIAVKSCDQPNRLYRPQEIRIHYTAPRLLRDEARALAENEKLESANWAQPMMLALGVPDDSRHNFEEHAVSLMPDWKPGSRSPEPDRLLLNFVLGPKEEKFVAHLRKEMKREPWPWTMQFNWNGDGHDSTLRWHREDWSKVKTKKEFPGQWFASASVKSFRLLSVDLGQKQAGAYAIIEVSCCLSDDEKKNARFIGMTEHGGEHHDWYARVLTTGLHKLPGEDAVVFRSVTELDKQRASARGKATPTGDAFREELSGSAGRIATKDESRKAIDLLTELDQLALLDEDPAKAAVECERLTFPLQNTKLLIALRRAQSFASKLHRWCWFLDPQDEKAREDQPVRRRTAIKEIAEADNHQWLDDKTREMAKARHAILGDAKEDPELHPEIVKALKDRLEDLVKKLPRWLEVIANRVYSSRRGQLVWRNHPEPGMERCHLLDFSLRTKEERDKLTKDEQRLGGQRGLAMERIEQLEELRKRCQSLNQMLRRDIGGKPPLSRDDSIPDPCPTILAKLDDIKEQRRNQTAHMILAQALGLTLAAPTEPKNDTEREMREAKDSHGEYVKVDAKGRPIPADKPESWRGLVDFIVIEDLSRYRTTQGRAPRENSRLMKWCHRAIRDKLKQMCEPFGVPLVETPAAYSSRFCSRTGVAGFRAVELSGDPLTESKWRWRIRKPEEGKKESDDQIKRRERWELLFSQVQKANLGRDGKSKGQELRTLLVPDAGGSIFIPISGLNEAYERPAKNSTNPKLHRPIIEFQPVKLEDNQWKQPRLIHADVNAAVNLGLRTVADPQLWSVHSRLRSERKFGTPPKPKPKTVRGKDKTPEPMQPDTFWVSEKEKRKYGEQTDEKRIEIKLLDAKKANLKASDSRHPNFFNDVADLKTWIHDGAATLEGLPVGCSRPPHLVSSKALWGYIKDQAWQRCIAINAARLKAWGIDPPKEWKT